MYVCAYSGQQRELHFSLVIVRGNVCQCETEKRKERKGSAFSAGVSQLNMGQNTKHRINHSPCLPHRQGNPVTFKPLWTHTWGCSNLVLLEASSHRYARHNVSKTKLVVMSISKVQRVLVVSQKIKCVIHLLSTTKCTLNISSKEKKVCVSSSILFSRLLFAHCLGFCSHGCWTTNWL